VSRNSDEEWREHTGGEVLAAGVRHDELDCKKVVDVDVVDV
jgi:hypothetical protein